MRQSNFQFVSVSMREGSLAVGGSNSEFIPATLLTSTVWFLFSRSRAEQSTVSTSLRAEANAVGVEFEFEFEHIIPVQSD
jgi:hypothetical protein